MPITFSFDAEQNRAVSRFSGTVTGAEILAHNTEMAESGAFSTERLMDARGAVTMLSPDEVRQVASLVRRLVHEFGPAKVAFVADNDLTYGMARMYEALSAPHDCGFTVVRTLEEAEVGSAGHPSR